MTAPPLDDQPTDQRTADAFASSWNRVGTVYTREQFDEWFRPLDPGEFEKQEVLELGFGNGSLLYHMATCSPARLVGVELGDTLEQTRANLAAVAEKTQLELQQGDLLTVDLGRFDLVYCIGVLHHLDDPSAGFDAVLRHTAPGQRFHCWVYAREGNLVVRSIVEPIRRVACRLPWWFTKYGLALPLVFPYFLYAKALSKLSKGTGGLSRLAKSLPLYEYSLWIARRRFAFFHHVAFDQLVTPQTTFLSQAQVLKWLRDSRVDPATTYLIFRNGNSWKFGGRRRAD
ncbi:MAG: class I SAM-dependent methyltransferase [Thermoanaerobaculia bacterium]|nr:class I SAM-dependent methyltransferase [Thermoanaerobaculia bacterium]